MAKGEIGFLNFIVIPLWSLLNKFANGELDKYILNLKCSVEEYKKIEIESK